MHYTINSKYISITTIKSSGQEDLTDRKRNVSAVPASHLGGALAAL